MTTSLLVTLDQCVEQGRVLFDVKNPFFHFYLKISLKSDLNFNIFETKEPQLQLGAELAFFLVEA